MKEMKHWVLQTIDHYEIIPTKTLLGWHKYKKGKHFRQLVNEEHSNGPSHRDNRNKNDSLCP